MNTSLQGTWRMPLCRHASENGNDDKDAAATAAAAAAKVCQENPCPCRFLHAETRRFSPETNRSTPPAERHPLTCLLLHHPDPPKRTTTMSTTVWTRDENNENKNKNNEDSNDKNNHDKNNKEDDPGQKNRASPTSVMPLLTIASHEEESEDLAAVQTANRPDDVPLNSNNSNQEAVVVVTNKEEQVVPQEEHVDAIVLGGGSRRDASPRRTLSTDDAPADTNSKVTAEDPVPEDQINPDTNKVPLFNSTRDASTCTQQDNIVALQPTRKNNKNLKTPKERLVGDALLVSQKNKLETALDVAHTQRSKMIAHIQRNKEHIAALERQTETLQSRLDETHDQLATAKDESIQRRLALDKMTTQRDELKNKLRLKNELFREVRQERDTLERAKKRTEQERALEQALLEHYRQLAKHTGYYKWGKQIRLLEAQLEAAATAAEDEA